jgi:starch phosphorylase
MPEGIKVGDAFAAQAHVFLGTLTPADVRVELFVGLVNPNGEIVKGKAIPMHVVKQTGGGLYLFEANVVGTMSGLHGYTVRVLPDHPDLVTPFLPGYIVWAT